jgi:anti-sigma factor RsiW
MGMTDDKLRELLREMKDEPIPADSLARVRRGVAARVASQASGWWKLAAGAAAVAMLALALWLHKPAAVTVAPEVAKAVPAAPVVETPAAAPAEAEPRAEVPVPRHARPVHRASRVIPVRTIPVRTVAQKGAVIRIETPDPNVVIVLVSN